MDQHGSAVGTQRGTRARTEQCPATEGSPGADRLSALSDELLLHILSSIEIRKAVSTSSLSRRWRSLYRRLPYLDFSSEVWDSASAWFIDRVLLLHAAPRIEAFRLSMRVNGNDSATCRQIDSWLLFAVRRDVRVLDLDFQEVHDPYYLVGNAVSYDLPPWIFHCGTLEDFSVQNCRLCLPAHIRLLSLTRMSLNRIEFQYDELKRLLPGCPLLQSLELVHCNRESHLDIDARENLKLEELVIVDGIEDDPDDPQLSHTTMQIVAPSVKHLIFKGAALRRRYEVRDLSSLTAASFHLDERRAVSVHEVKVFTTDLLGRVRQVRELKLCWWSVQALFERKLRDNWSTAFPGVTTLELRVGLQRYKMLGSLSALRACHKLRTLVLSILRPFYESSDSDEIESLFALYFDIEMQDLKTITVRGLTRSNQGHGEEDSEEDFVARKNGYDIALIGFLLKVSPALEKLIVQLSKDVDVMARKWELLFHLSSHLLSLPRASPNAYVIVDGK